MKKNDTIICYDLTIVPERLEVDTLFHVMKKSGILFYDSYKTDKKPYVLKGRTDRLFIDVSTKEGAERLKNILNEKED